MTYLWFFEAMAQATVEGIYYDIPPYMTVYVRVFESV